MIHQTFPWVTRHCHQGLERHSRRVDAPNGLQISQTGYHFQAIPLDSVTGSFKVSRASFLAARLSASSPRRSARPTSRPSRTRPSSWAPSVPKPRPPRRRVAAERGWMVRPMVASGGESWPHQSPSCRRDPDHLPAPRRDVVVICAGGWWRPGRSRRPAPRLSALRVYSGRGPRLAALRVYSGRGPRLVWGGAPAPLLPATRSRALPPGRVQRRLVQRRPVEAHADSHAARRRWSSATRHGPWRSRGCGDHTRRGAGVWPLSL